jgi:hypothetical protein
LQLGRHDGVQTWKGFDWDTLDRLHQKGYIQNPVNKYKSLAFTAAGLQESERLLRELFSVQTAPPSSSAGSI